MIFPLRTTLTSIGVCLLLAGCAGVEDTRLSLINQGDYIEQDPLETAAFTPVSGRYGRFLQARHAEAVSDHFTAARIQHGLWRENKRNGLFGYSALHNAMLSGQHQMAIELARTLREMAVQPVSPNNQNAAAVILAMEHLKHGRSAATIREAQNAIVPVGIAQYVQPLLIAWGHVQSEDYAAAFAVLEANVEHSAMRNVYLLNMAYIDLLAGNFPRAEKNINALRTSLDRPPVNVITLYAATVFWQHGESVAHSFIRTIEDDKLRADLEAKILDTSGFTLADIQLSDAISGLGLGMDEISKLMVAEAPSLALFYAYISAYLNPANDTPNYIIGDVLFGLDRFDEALRILGKISNPKSPLYRDAISLAAETEQRIGQREKAIARLKAAIKRFPDDSDLLFDLGQIYHYEQDYENVVRTLTQTIESRQGQPNWSDYYFRGIAYERTDRWPLAEQDFLSARKIRPNNAYVLNYLGYSWIDQRKNIPEAFKMLERAVELDPDNAFIVDSLGWAFYRLEDFTNAAIHLERAVEMEPAEAVINDHLGDVYWHLGRRLEARYQWERALSLEPDTEEQRAAVRAKLAGTQQPKP